MQPCLHLYSHFARQMHSPNISFITHKMKSRTIIIVNVIRVRTLRICSGRENPKVVNSEQLRYFCQSYYLSSHSISERRAKFLQESQTGKRVADRAVPTNLKRNEGGQTMSKKFATFLFAAAVLFAWPATNLLAQTSS